MRVWLHRHLWQRLPRPVRRRALFGVASWLAPRPGQRPPSCGPFYVAGPLRTASGLGESARLCLSALIEAGFDAAGIDISFGDDTKRQDTDFPEAGNMEGPGTIILHVNGFLTPLAMMLLGAKRLRGKTIIGYWAWELPELPREWLAGFRFVHEIWTPSAFVAKAVAARTALPVRVLHHPIAGTRAFASHPGMGTNLSKGVAHVLTAFDMASSFARKNPLAAIAAFKAAFGDDPAWHLLVKVNDAAAYPEGRSALAAAIGSAKNITLIERVLTAEEMVALIASAEIILSLHRSEGFGLVLAEAMLNGKAVVATDWSGNADFMTSENSCPVSYRLVPAEDPQGTYNHTGQFWAEADIRDAARWLELLKVPGTRNAIGDRARRDAQSMFSAARYAALVKSYLNVTDPP